LYTFYYSYVADHYQYLACLGLAGLAAGLGAVSCQKIVSLRPFQTPVAGAILLVLGLLTWRQCGIYRDLETLWTDTLAKNPQSWMAHVNLGRLQSNRGQFDQAEAHYRSAMAINSSNESIRYNYANMLARSGRLDAAVEQYRQVLAMAPDKAEAHNNLGVLLNRLHHPDEAVAEYELALFYQPDYADAYYNLGNALSAEQRLDMAVLAYERAARLKPESETFRKRLRAVMGGGN
jgi:tetratricopeptide (TPR) repeat protein